MKDLAATIAADTTSPAAIPRLNGEPVFNEPWESRVFGMAVGLCERGCYQWSEFQAGLIAEIAAADARQEQSTYYERFLRVLQRLIVEKSVCAAGEIEKRAAEEAAATDSDH
ncbi:MAG TPA: nitrile hydratase accessory protein [Candidatus Binataceae bacterium]|nr:nitrile hydratase accessory protein [Candidatus Binataceae bacterium]